MTDKLERGSAWLAAKGKAHATQTVLYIRGLNAVSLQATPGRAELEQQDAYGILCRIESRTFMFNAADLILSDGLQTTPQAGDAIQESVNGTTNTYELLSLPNQQSWRWADPYRHKLIVHTKLVGTS